jgi:hypothetical protein
MKYIIVINIEYLKSKTECKCKEKTTSFSIPLEIEELETTEKLKVTFADLCNNCHNYITNGHKNKQYSVTFNKGQYAKN